jgi:acetyltransferase-like isoleucine patch superfamily enzyme
MIGPNVQLITSSHPLDPATRRRSITTAPIRIGGGAWIAPAPRSSKASPSPTTPSSRAGAVVTNDVPPRTLVAGVPTQGHPRV